MPSRISQMRNGTSQLPFQMPQETPQNSTPAVASPQFQINEAYLNQIKAMMRSKNPQQMLANLAAQNPQMQQVLQLIANGGNPRAIFESLARQKGVDPQWVINQLMN